MDWLEYKVVLNYFDKTFTYTEDNGDNIKVKGIPRKVAIREISALQIKILVIKGGKVFYFYTMNGNENDNTIQLEDIPVLKEFENMFLEEVLECPLKRDIDFTIDLIP